MGRKEFPGLLERHVLDVAEVGIATYLCEPLDGLADRFLAEFGMLSHGSLPLKGVMQRGKILLAVSMIFRKVNKVNG